jgi:uncharacterized phage protein gp47/JayE
MDISQSYNNLKNLILAERSDLTVLPKSVVSDTFLIPAATEWTRLNVLIAFVAGLQSFESILNMLTDETFLDSVAEALNLTIDDVRAIITGALDQLATNYNKTRKAAVTATGVVSFYRQNPLTSGETGNVISSGIEVYTNSGITYRVTSDVPYTNIYYDPNYNVYMIDVPIQSQSPGSPGNTTEFTITNLRSAVSGFANVTNKLPVTNGLDQESNEDFANRMKAEISGNNWGTPNGIKSTVLQQFPHLSDLLVVSAGDPIMFRDSGWGGRPDVYLLERNWQLYSLVVPYNGEQVTYIGGNRPISAGHSITSSEGEFTFYADSTSLEAGSVRSRDYIVWIVKPVGPYPKDITLTYFYDKNVTDVQTFLTSDDRNTGADILTKQSTEILVDVFFELVIFPGYTFATVVDNIRTVLVNFIDGFLLGTSLEQSDVINQIYTVEGVDRVVLPMSKFNRAELTGAVDRVVANKNEYIRLNVLSVG